MTGITQSQTFILLSFAIGVICVFYIRSKDRFEKEPLFILATVVLWGGVWSYVISGILYETLARWGIDNLANARGALLVIGPVEEISKLAALFSCYFFIRKQLNEPVDGLLYMACVALGFSLIENYYYAMSTSQGATALFFSRLLICTPAHINFSAFMGLAFYMFVKNRHSFPLLVAAFCYGAIVHGVYDMIAFSGMWLFLLVVVVWLSYRFAVKLLGYATAKSQFRINLANYLNDDARPRMAFDRPCPVCREAVVGPTIHLHAHRITRCENCGNFVTSSKGLRSILHHFVAAPAKSFFGRLDMETTAETRPSGDPIVRKSPDGQTVAFDLAQLNRMIDIDNQRIIDQVESRWWYPKVLATES